MKIFKLVTDFQVLGLLLIPSILFFYNGQIWPFILCSLFIIVLISSYFLLEKVGWRKGELHNNEQELIFAGDVKIALKKGEINELDETETGTFTTWYDYHIIALTSKKYDIKIKSRKEDKGELLELLRRYHQQ